LFSPFPNERLKVFQNFTSFPKVLQGLKKRLFGEKNLGVC